MLGRFFRNLSFGAKLRLGFGLLITVAFAMSVVAFLTTYMMSAAAERASNAEDLRLLANSIDAELQSARGSEKDYLLNYRAEGFDAAYTNYVVATAGHVSNVLNLIAELQLSLNPSVSEEREVLGLLDQIQDLTLEYQAAFSTIVTDIRTRGLAGSGYEGELQSSAQSLLDASELANPDSQVMVREMLRHERDYLLYGGDDNIAATQSANMALQEWIQNLDIPTTRRDALVSLTDSYIAAFDALIAQENEIALAINDLETLAEQITPLVSEVVAAEETAASHAMEELRATQRTALIIEVALLALMATVGTGLIIVVSNALTGQVDEINKVFRAVIVGNFDARARVLSNDELGQVADGMNAMVEMLADLLVGAERVGEERLALLDNLTDLVALIDPEGKALYVNPAGMAMTGYEAEDFESLAIPAFYPPDEFKRVQEEYLPAVTARGYWTGETVLLHKDGSHIPVSQVIVLIRDQEGQTRGMGTIMRDISEHKRVITDVETIAEQVMGASATMADIVQIMVERAASSADMAEQATLSAHEGNQAVGETVAAMMRIRDNTQETARRIRRLGEVTQEISEAVRFIEDLADRTSVLALNASIQAAAAGEAGRGFAVVAEEVQRLAERATGATRQIEDLVKSIQAETSEVVHGVEDATLEVVDGSRLAQEAGERMAELNRVVGELTTLIQHVAEMTAAQTGESMAALTTLSSDLVTAVAGFGGVDVGEEMATEAG